jgi:uncharacterized membrane protein
LASPRRGFWSAIDFSDGREQIISLETPGLRPHIRSMSCIRNGGTLVKTASFAVVHFTVAFSVGYLLTGSVAIASALALIEPAANTLAYYVHERVWQRFSSRRAGRSRGARGRPLSRRAAYSS